VKDTGPGIPEKLQEQIFEPFITLEQTNRKFEGIGLGLSIARRLVALHHGILQLESKVGQGSTFHIYLPLPSLSGEKPLEFAERQALFVISSQENLSPEVLLLSNRQKLEVVRIGSIDVVENLLNQFQPTAVMWDLSQAKPTEWNIVRRLRNHPRLVDAAFILLNQNSLPAGESLRSISTFVLKHAKGQSLMDAINGLFSPEVQITVLIVDDDAHFIDLFVDVVRVALPGSRIMTASTGKQAIACMEETLPGLVILDLVMPEMDGFSVLDWIRGNDTTHNVPVIIMSNRLLTREDINRLENHAQVTLQTKGLLNKDEIAQQLFRTLFSTDTLPAYTSLLVKRVIGYMHQNYMCDFSRTALADEIGVSEDYLSRVFCREMGISPWDYLRRYRIFHAKVDLNRTSKSIESIAHQVGFSDPAYFSRVFRQVTGVSPRIYRNETDKSK
jgi:AraC-like DNA-binding protein